MVSGSCWTNGSVHTILHFINHVTFRNPNTSTSSAFHLAIHIVCTLCPIVSLRYFFILSIPKTSVLTFILSHKVREMLFLSPSACPLSAFYSNKQPWNLDSQLSRTSRTCENKEWPGPLSPDSWAISHDSIITALLYWSLKPFDAHCPS